MDKLPVEILTKIIEYLTPREQVQLQSVSKRLFALARDNNLWRLHCYEESRAAAENLNQTRRASESLLVNSTASLSSLGQTSLRFLIQPQITTPNDVQVSSLGTRSRAAAGWDPSIEGEDVNWYSEYIARTGPISLSWLQQPSLRTTPGNRKIYSEIRGMGLLKDWSSARENKVVAPLQDGSVCIWDLNHSHCTGSRATKGKILGISAPGILTTDLSRRRDHSASKTALEFINVGECVSVDSLRRRAFIAVGNILNEVDLETLRVVSQQRYPWSIFAMSQETDYSVPLTLATTLSLQIYDSRLSGPDEEEAISLRCEKEAVRFVPESQLFTQPDSPLLQLRPNGLPPHRIRSPEPSEKGVNYAPLFQPGPLSILHPPAPHFNTILLAGRFPSILCYDRRFFPHLQNTVHSGGRLCGLASVPTPRFPVFSDSTWPESHTVVACGEYNGRGSLELYNLTSSTQDKNPSDSTSNLSSVYRNRQSAARSKVLSVASHGTRIVFSDADGNIKWVERDGQTEVRRWNINSCQPPQDSSGHPPQAHTPSQTIARSAAASDNEDPDDDESTGIWSTDSDDGRNEVARKILPTGGYLTGDELLIWTGERIGRVMFSHSTDPGMESDEEDDMSSDGEVDGSSRDENRRRRQEEKQREREYSRMMRRALERQADEVRWMGRLGMT